MKKLALTLAILTVSVNLYAYRLNKVAEAGARWQTLPISFTLNPNNSGLPSSEVQRVITDAMDNWNSNTGILMLEVSNVNTSLRASSAMDPDDTNAIVFSSNFQADTGFDADTTVAVGGQFGDGESMSSAFVVFNADSVGWDTDKMTGTLSTGYKDDLGTIALHELGHTLGLGHSEIATAVMSASRVSKINRVLTDDDINGAKYLAQSSVQGSGSVTGGGSNKSSSGSGVGGCGTISGNGGNNGGNIGGMLTMMLLPMCALVAFRRKVVTEN